MVMAAAQLAMLVFAVVLVLPNAYADPRLMRRMPKVSSESSPNKVVEAREHTAAVEAETKVKVKSKGWWGPNDSCEHAEDQHCDELISCDIGTDCTDCGNCEQTFHECEGTCWHAQKSKHPTCHSYDSVGYTCVGAQCAACNPSGDPAICAEQGASGTSPDPKTGKCVGPLPQGWTEEEHFSAATMETIPAYWNPKPDPGVLALSRPEAMPHEQVVVDSSAEQGLDMEEGDVAIFGFYVEGSGQDIQFSTHFQADDGSASTEVHAAVRTKQISGTTFTATSKGKLVMVFDNSHSIFYSKTIWYELEHAWKDGDACDWALDPNGQQASGVILVAQGFLPQTIAEKRRESVWRKEQAWCLTFQQWAIPNSTYNNAMAFCPQTRCEKLCECAQTQFQQIPLPGTGGTGKCPCGEAVNFRDAARCASGLSTRCGQGGWSCLMLALRTSPDVEKDAAQETVKVACAALDPPVDSSLPEDSNATSMTTALAERASHERMLANRDADFKTVQSTNLKDGLDESLAGKCAS